MTEGAPLSGPATPAAAAAAGQVVFTVNGPGEVSAWLYPLVVGLRQARPDLRICVCLLPCVFSSGAEATVLRALGALDGIADVRQSLALVRRGRLPDGFRRDLPTLVFHLGGEVALTLAIAGRLRAPLYAYAERPPGFRRFFRRVFYSGLEPLPPRIAAAAGDPVGDLMVDAAALRRAAAGPRGPGRVLGLFPGSRDYMITNLLTYYAVAVDALAARHPDLRFVMAKADFLPDSLIRDLPAPRADRTWQAHAVTYREDGTARWFETERGTRIGIASNAEVLARADLALTIPGTNTGEIAACGIPMVVVLPTYLAEIVPLPGIAGHVGRLPRIGPALKRFFGRQVLRGLPLLSLPNRRAGRRIVPEFVGRGILPAAEAALEDLLAGDLGAVGAELRAAMGPPGAAARLVGAISDHFGRA